MTKRDKRLEAIKRNPGAVRPDDLFAALEAEGWTCEKNGTSHRVYRKAGRGHLSIPYRRPYLKPFYVLAALEAIEAEEQ